MNNVARYESRKGRKLVVDGVEWKWVYGRSYVVAYSKDGDKKCARVADVMQITETELERRKWKDTDNQAVTPNMIADWIRYT